MTRLPFYEEWVIKVEARYSDAKKHGAQFELIRLSPDQFAAWCNAKGLGPGEASRMEYASAVMARRQQVGRSSAV